MEKDLVSQRPKAFTASKEFFAIEAAGRGNDADGVAGFRHFRND
jgi:hypothetical protein